MNNGVDPKPNICSGKVINKLFLYYTNEILKTPTSFFFGHTNLIRVQPSVQVYGPVHAGVFGVLGE